MIYCIDSNFFITGWQQYYSPEISEDFWKWLENLAFNNEIFTPKEVYEELEVGGDSLFIWIKKIKDIIVRELDKKTQEYVKEIITKPEAKSLVDTNKKHYADVFVVAYAKRYNATVVSNDNGTLSLARSCNVRAIRFHNFLKEKKLKMKVII